MFATQSKTLHFLEPLESNVYNFKMIYNATFQIPCQTKQ